MTSEIGKIGWIDLTVTDAVTVRDFYKSVVGWRAEGVAMDGYDDYCMLPEEGGAVAGVCHARGVNTGLPAQWLLYITVANLERSLAAVHAGGGEVVRPTKSLGGHGRFAVVKDPAGAVCALFEKTGGAA